jgi:hypothetical protein
VAQLLCPIRRPRPVEQGLGTQALTVRSQVGQAYTISYCPSSSDNLIREWHHLHREWRA